MRRTLALGTIALLAYRYFRGSSAREETASRGNGSRSRKASKASRTSRSAARSKAKVE